MPESSTDTLRLGTNTAPDIKVVFRGFIVTIIKHGATSATIGALEGVDGAACHKPVTQVFAIDGATEATTELMGLGIGVDQDISLNVIGQSGIEVFQTDEDIFNPLDIDNDVKDFRWFVDLNKIHNRDEAHSIAIDMSKLKPKFTLNKGLFHVSKLSDGEVRIFRYNRPRSKRFGRFGTEITARIQLEPDHQAVLQYGATEVLRMGGLHEKNRYEIVFDCTCRSTNEIDSDFGAIYDVIRNQNGSPIDVTERVRLESPANTSVTPEEFQALLATGGSLPALRVRTPEVYCNGGNCSVC